MACMNISRGSVFSPLIKTLNQSRSINYCSPSIEWGPSKSALDQIINKLSRNTGRLLILLSKLLWLHWLLQDVWVFLSSATLFTRIIGVKYTSYTMTSFMNKPNILRLTVPLIVTNFFFYSTCYQKKNHFQSTLQITTRSIPSYDNANIFAKSYH